MPAYFPEGNTGKPGDDDKRLLHKWAAVLYAVHGDKGPAYFPEGSEPKPGDTEDRLREKINALRTA